MATLYEHFESGENDDRPISVTVHPSGQSFTPSVTHTIITWSIKGYKSGTPGTLTVNIRTTSPTGTSIASGTIDANSFTPTSPGDWYDISLGTGALLTADTKYYAVLTCSGGDVRWRENTGGGYSGGDVYYWNGSSWDVKTEDYYFREYGPSIALTGTATSFITETDIVNGGKTIILTLTGDTWIAAGATSFDLQRQNIINGLTSAQSETLGWNNIVKTLQGVAGVVRTSDTVVTITFDAQATYNITATETITATIPATALTGGVAIVASPTFTVSEVAGGGVITPLRMLMGVGV